MWFCTVIKKKSKDIAKTEATNYEDSVLSNKYITGKKVLDVGAATGNLSKFLKNEGYDVISIDINEKLIEQAREKNVDVKNLDMMRIDELGKFDTIINVGNTLPHLNSKDEIFLFLKKAYSQLENNGKLIIQLINFYKFFENQKTFIYT